VTPRICAPIDVAGNEANEEGSTKYLYMLDMYALPLQCVSRRAQIVSASPCPRLSTSCVFLEDHLSTSATPIHIILPPADHVSSPGAHRLRTPKPGNHPVRRHKQSTRQNNRTRSLPPSIPSIPNSEFRIPKKPRGFHENTPAPRYLPTFHTRQPAAALSGPTNIRQPAAAALCKRTTNIRQHATYLCCGILNIFFFFCARNPPSRPGSPQAGGHSPPKPHRRTQRFKLGMASAFVDFRPLSGTYSHERRHHRT
jgi:hypothetical protein